MSQLLWNERGQIGCTKPGHAPYPGSDTYYFERWEPLDEGTAKRSGFRCEVCAAAERREHKARNP